MELDESWAALFRPGRAKKHFQLEPIPPMDLSATDYSPVNAWWMAEFSRLIYKVDMQDPDPSPWTQEVRQTLRRVDVETLGVFQDQETHTYGLLLERPGASILVFCGSNAPGDWKVNVSALQRPWSGNAWVHTGFLTALNSVWPAVRDAIAGLRTPLFVTGHSLGGALATLAALRLTYMGYAPRACYTYGAPRVGNEDFARLCDGLPLYRVMNFRDAVPSLPVDLQALTYRHGGRAYYIDGQGTLRANWSEREIDADRRPPDVATLRAAIGSLTELKRFTQEFRAYLSDHAPINYVSRLSQALNKAQGNGNLG